MPMTVRKCKHCGCAMPCKTSRKLFCSDTPCRTNHYNHKALIMTFQKIAQTPFKQGIPQWLQLEALIPS